MPNPFPFQKLFEVIQIPELTKLNLTRFITVSDRSRRVIRLRRSDDMRTKLAVEIAISPNGTVVNDYFAPSVAEILLTS